MTRTRSQHLASFAFVAGIVLAFASGGAAQSPAAGGARANPPPPKILAAFQRGYPGAEISATSNEEVDGTAVVRVDCTDKGRKKVARYKADGSLFEAGEPVTEQQLPAPVAAAMHSHPRAIFASGLKLTRAGAVHYELELRGTRKTTMLVKPDGTVISFR